MQKDEEKTTSPSDEELRLEILRELIEKGETTPEKESKRSEPKESREPLKQTEWIMVTPVQDSKSTGQFISNNPPTDFVFIEDKGQRKKRSKKGEKELTPSSSGHGRKRKKYDELVKHFEFK